MNVKNRFLYFFLSIVLIFSTTVIYSSALSSLNLQMYKYNDKKGGYTIFAGGGSAYKSKANLPYGNASRLFEGRHSRNIGGSFDCYCFTIPEGFIFRTATNMGTQTITYGSNSLFGFGLTDYMQYLATAWYTGSHLYIYSAAPIFKYSSGQWVVPNTQQLRTIHYVDKDGRDISDTFYYISIDVGYSFTVGNYIPYDIISLDYPTITSYQNAYSYIPTLEELSQDYSEILSTISGSLYRLEETTQQIYSSMDDIKVRLDDIIEAETFTGSQVEEFKEFVFNNIYPLLETIDYDIFSNFDTLFSKLDEYFQHTPSNGFSDFEHNETFDDAFNSDSFDLPDLSEFTGGISAFTNIYNNLDRCFGGLLSVGIGVVLSIALISFLLGRRVNKG